LWTATPKAAFATNDETLKAATGLKGRFPMLQVKVDEAEEKRAKRIELAAA
jgi:hypothetical protein